METFKLITVVLSMAVLLCYVTAYKRVCYYSNWSQYRPREGKFVPSDIDPSLCTHLIYAFAKLDHKHELATFEWNDEALYKQFNRLKDGRDVKTLIAVGGWNAGSERFTEMVTNEALRKKFSTKAVEYLIKYNFDGLDLDWEYPALRGGAPTDKENFILLLEDLKQAMLDASKPELLLTAAVAAGKSNIDTAYDIPGMARNLDFINLMSYDLHGAWENFTGHNSPLYSRSSESGTQATLNVDWAAKYWVAGGVKPENLIIGLPTYGRHFTLVNPSNQEMGDPASGAGLAGKFTRENGYLAYYEVCRMLASGAKYFWHEEHKVPYLVRGNQWVGYDNERSFEIKLKYIMNNNYGGAMIWNTDLDDFNMLCSRSERKYPLMSLMKEVLEGDESYTTLNPVIHNEGPEIPVTGGPDTDRPDATDKTTAGPSGGVSCDGVPNGYYPNTADCSKFYQCVNNVKYEFLCPSGLLWSKSSSLCDYPYAVDCIESTNPPVTTQKTTETRTMPQVIDTTTDTPTNTPIEQPPITNPPGEFCVGKANGQYSKEDNCAQFHSCVWETTFVQDCPAGLFYNAQGKYCDYHYNVECGNRLVVGVED